MEHNNKKAVQQREANARYKAKYPERILAAQDRYRAKYPDRIITAQRRWALKRYGITLEEYNDLLRSQGFACAICGIGEPIISNGKGRAQWHVDHCHATKRVRGILCGRCNLALGLFKDNPIIIRSALRYLKK